MPTKPPRACRTCGRAGCLQHPRASAAARGYGGDWPEYAREWLQVFPWCGQRHDGKFYGEHSICVRAGQKIRAKVVDHIQPVSDGGARLDPANHQSLCMSCNTLKG